MVKAAGTRMEKTVAFTVTMQLYAAKQSCIDGKGSIRAMEGMEAWLQHPLASYES